jgi:hypothetical protein
MSGASVALRRAISPGKEVKSSLSFAVEVQLARAQDSHHGCTVFVRVGTQHGVAVTDAFYRSRVPNTRDAMYFNSLGSP